MAQDDWRNDTSGVEYYHLLGIQKFDQTVDTILAEPFAKEPLSIVKKSLRFKAEIGKGDGTVPRISAERCQNEECLGGSNINFGNAEVIRFYGENKAEDKQFSHVGLVKSTAVRQKILDILGLPNQLAISNNQINGGKAMKIITTKGENLVSQNPPASGQSYYLQIGGTDRLKITDDEGNTNTPVGDAGFEIGVPGVNYFGGSEDESFHSLAMPAEEGEYTVKFRTGTDSIDIELVRGIGNRSPNLAIRYIDLRLPTNVECLLTLNPQEVEDLRYDSNGDGTYDTVVPAHVRVSGTVAQDVTAPTVKIVQDTLNKSRPITITAADSQSGGKTIYYRIVGSSTNFQIYTAPFSLPRGVGKRTIEAFADDNVGNRSSPVQSLVLAPN